LWREALKEWDMVESKIVKEWQAQGEARGKAGAVLDVLEARFGVPPADLAARIRSCDDLEQLRHWTKQAASAASLEAFRQAIQK
jgi:hypothetical protein